MPDREKALRLLTSAIDTAFGANCELVKLPVTVAIEIEQLLREQESVPKYTDPHHAYCGFCGCRIPLKTKARYCHKCGRKVKWDA